MGTRLRRGWWIGAFALAALAGCGEPSRQMKDLEKEAGEAWDAAKAYGVSKRADAERAFASSVDRLSRSYETAKAKAKAAGEDASRTLEPKWDEVRQKLKDLKSASAEQWERARDAFVKAYEAFEKEISSGS